MALGMSTGLGALAVAGLGTAFLCITLLVLVQSVQSQQLYGTAEALQRLQRRLLAAMSPAMVGGNALDDGEDPRLDGRRALELGEPATGDPENVLRGVFQPVPFHAEQAQRAAREVEVLAIDELEAQQRPRQRRSGLRRSRGRLRLRNGTQVGDLDREISQSTSHHPTTGSPPDCSLCLGVRGNGSLLSEPASIDSQREPQPEPPDHAGRAIYFAEIFQEKLIPRERRQSRDQ